LTPTPPAADAPPRMTTDTLDGIIAAAEELAEEAHGNGNDWNTWCLPRLEAIRAAIVQPAAGAGAWQSTDPDKPGYRDPVFTEAAPPPTVTHSGGVSGGSVGAMSITLPQSAVDAMNSGKEFSITTTVTTGEAAPPPERVREALFDIAKNAADVLWTTAGFLDGAISDNDASGKLQVAAARSVYQQLIAVLAASPPAAPQAAPAREEKDGE